MNFFYDLSPKTNQLVQESQKGLKTLFQSLESFGREENLALPHISDLHLRVFQILEGHLRVSFGDKLFFLLEKGDGWMFPLPMEMSFHSDFPIRARVWTSEKIEAALQADVALQNQWNAAYQSMFKVFLQMSAELLPGALSIDTETEIYEAGQTIIQQGSTGREVFTLLEGSAKVICDGMEVGRICANEIFGAIAALSQIPRTASVVADEACTVMKIAEDQFLKLAQSRPETMLRLCKDLAIKLSELNQKMLGLG